MRVVAALGGNALLERSQPQTLAQQWINVRKAAVVLAELVGSGHELIVTHGNGPQVGRLASQGYEYDPENVDTLDVLDAQTEGMIGYLIEQELHNAAGPDASIATVLTRVEVDRGDPAFEVPTKPVGPIISTQDAIRLGNVRKWQYQAEGWGKRRVVPSPLPLRVLCQDIIATLIGNGTTVVCAGGGGIPVICDCDGRWTGVEAVIDKDRTSALLATGLDADALLLLTDVDGVYDRFGTARSRKLEHIGPAEMNSLKSQAESMSGSMWPKLEAAMQFVEQADSAIAKIGCLGDAAAMLNGSAGTRLSG